VTLRPSVATVLLIGVTAVWGWTFVVIHDALALYGVMAFLAVRFTLAAAITGAIWGHRLDRATLRVGMAIGLILAAGYLLQTWSLRFTTATNTGLITGLFVVLAPVIDRLLYGTKLRPVAWLMVALSVIGMTLLTGRLPTEFALGDVLAFGCAVAFGAHIAVLSHAAPGRDPLAMTTAQMTSMAVLFVILWPLTETVQAPPRGVWFAIALTGVVGSAVAYAIQTAAQKVLSTVRTSLILTMEPVFAGLFGLTLAGDRLSPTQFAGGLLIIGAVVASELFATRPADPAVE
jgi:drug/metabolite transporter (DMT)-like permease